MQANAVDAVEFRDGQRKSWDTAATGWRKWSKLIDERTGKVSERLVELAGIEPGSRVLDIAAGYGEPTLTAAKKAGADGKVVATDISAEMLGYGRERATAAGLDNIEFVQSEAAALDFSAGSFNAALSRWGIIFEPEPEATAAKVRSFLEPGSRMAISSWGPPERVPFIAAPMQVAMKRLNVPPPPPGTPGPLSRPTPEAIGGLLETGGFSDVSVEETQVTFEMESAEQFTTFIKEIAPPLTALITPHPQDVQDETWAAITEAMRDRADSDGALRLTNLVLLASGRA